MLLLPLRLGGWTIVAKAAALKYPDAPIKGESARVVGRAAHGYALPVSAVVTLPVAASAVPGCGHGPLLSRVPNNPDISEGWSDLMRPVSRVAEWQTGGVGKGEMVILYSHLAHGSGSPRESPMKE